MKAQGRQAPAETKRIPRVVNQAQPPTLLVVAEDLFVKINRFSEVFPRPVNNLSKSPPHPTPSSSPFISDKQMDLSGIFKAPYL